MSTKNYKFIFQTLEGPTTDNQNQNTQKNNDKKIFPNFKVLFTSIQRYDSTKTTISTEVYIPFPPYTTSSNFQIFLNLASIFGTFIANSTVHDLKDMELSKWLYYYRVNYPHMPNIYNLILSLDLLKDEMVEYQSPASIRSIIHKFCEVFSKESKLKIKEFSMAIPSKPVFKDIEADIIIFIPIITPISAFAPNRKDVNIQDDGKFYFPSELTVKYEQSVDSNGSAFSTNENNNDNSNSNTNVENSNNNNNNNNNNNDNSNNNNNTNTNTKTSTEITYSFYAGIFESSQGSSKYVLVKIEDKYYKYDCVPNKSDYKNCVLVVKPKDVMLDYCVASFFLKDSCKSLFSSLYQTVPSNDTNQ